MNDNNLECYICLEPVSNDINSNTYILECCNNPVHLDCLQQWYSNNKSNPNCFICNQHNEFCNDLFDPVIDNSYTLININNTNTIQISNIVHPTRQDTINNRLRNVTSILIVAIVVIVICVVLF